MYACTCPVHPSPSPAIHFRALHIIYSESSQTHQHTDLYSADRRLPSGNSADPISDILRTNAGFAALAE